MQVPPIATVLPFCPGLELISFSQLVCQCRQGLCYLMPYRYHLKATSKVSPSTKTPPVRCGQVAPTYQLPLLILYLLFPWSKFLGCLI